MAYKETRKNELFSSRKSGLPLAKGFIEKISKGWLKGKPRKNVKKA